MTYDARTRDRDSSANSLPLRAAQDCCVRLALGGGLWVALVVALVAAPAWVALACGIGLLWVALGVGLIAMSRH
jgi:hypothetical protein